MVMDLRRYLQDQDALWSDFVTGGFFSLIDTTVSLGPTLKPFDIVAEKVIMTSSPFKLTLLTQICEPVRIEFSLVPGAALRFEQHKPAKSGRCGE